MNIQLENVGKKFGREWIFRKVNHVFTADKPTVILGANGSGKSTLLQVISGSLMEGEGKLFYSLNGKNISQDSIYSHVSIAAPYLELMEDFTLMESIAFHGKFKTWRNKLTNQDILECSGLLKAKDKQLKNFSSGMKQRVKLILAILSDTKILLLDEPCSNLDRQACEWYGNLIKENASSRTLIVCSNAMKEEYFFCQEELKMETYK